MARHDLTIRVAFVQTGEQSLTEVHAAGQDTECTSQLVVHHCGPRGLAILA
jgi:hypothetical protein